MTYLWTVIPVLQILFAIHAYRNGNILWIFIILFFPGIGVLIYLFVEYLPSLKRGTGLQSASGSVARMLLPNREIQRLKDALSLSDTISNRLALADCYMANNQVENAIPVYENCLEGAYKNDPNLLFTLSKAYYADKKYQSALDKLLLIKKENAGFYDKGVPMLIAKSYDKLGSTDKALQEYEKLVNVCAGEEMRCRYALLLKKTGKLPEANKLFETIIKNAKVSPGYYNASEKEWVKIAKNEITALKKQSLV